MKSQKSYKG